ncbi:MAG: DUF1232 domain-containing protein [Anaerolineae bacterium]|nr:DUF1232 domain-containing protein [Anaerolineae bacterium]
MVVARWKARVKSLKSQTYALYLAYRQPDVPWYAKALAACVVAYAFSPIDLIPDFIPVLGYLDDLILVPLGLWLAIRLIPAPVWARCQRQAESALAQDRPTSRAAAAIIVGIWIITLDLFALLVVRALR